jgi:uncharacterized membrane protein YgaE (UPF0421/DUF939 family)
MRRPYLRLAAWSSVAAAAAYAIAEPFEHVNSAVAAIIALVSIRPTFHETAAESSRQVVGVLLGAALGMILTVHFGYSPWVILVLVAASFALARLLRLGEEGAAAMGVTVILVVGPTFDPELVETRFLGALVGAAVAVVASLWVLPGKPHRRALTAAVTASRDAAQLLEEISEALHAGDALDETRARGWVERAEKLMRSLADVRDRAESALRSSLWSPLVDQEEAAAVVAQVQVAQVAARTSYSIARDLLVAAEKNVAGLPQTVASGLAQVLSATATALTGQAVSAETAPAAPLDDTTTKALNLAEAHASATAQVKDLDATQPLLLAGSLLRDSEKIAAALTDTPTAPVPTVPKLTVRRRK